MPTWSNAHRQGTLWSDMERQPVGRMAAYLARSFHMLAASESRAMSATCSKRIFDKGQQIYLRSMPSLDGLGTKPICGCQKHSVSWSSTTHDAAAHLLLVQLHIHTVDHRRCLNDRCAARQGVHLDAEAAVHRLQHRIRPARVH